MIKTFLGILALQIIFGAILVGAVCMGTKADHRCKAWVHVKGSPPWAPARRCETR